MTFNKKLFTIFLFAIVSSVLITATISYTQINAAEAKQQFKAKLNGEKEVPPVSTIAEGKIKLKVKEKSIKYKLNITGITDATAAHIHQGKVGENGEPVVDLLAGGNKIGSTNGVFINGTITDTSLIGPMKGKTISDLSSSINSGNNYVNVHTEAHPDGEIRGQLELSGSANMTSSSVDQVDTEADSE
jgi:hypothetical protein